MVDTDDNIVSVKVFTVYVSCTAFLQQIFDTQTLERAKLDMVCKLTE